MQVALDRIRADIVGLFGAGRALRDLPLSQGPILEEVYHG